MSSVSTVAERLDAVRARIASAARAARRDPASIRLVAVSKTKPPELIREAHAAGQRDFGENYVQELAQKAEALVDLPDVVWHFIGHLQRNKAKQVVRIARVVHTVDSPRLAQELGRRVAEWRAESPGRERLRVLVEVNVGGEAQKSGCRPGDLAAVLQAIAEQPALHAVGLMTVPPHTDDPAGARPFFDELVRLRDAHGGAELLPELSMGMTHDLEHAIHAGATVVRVGTAIFGERG